MEVREITRFRPQELADRLGCYVTKETVNDDTYWFVYTAKPECLEKVCYIPRDETGNYVGECYIFNKGLIKDTTKDKCHIWTPRKSGGNDEES